MEIKYLVEHFLHLWHFTLKSDKKPWEYKDRQFQGIYNYILQNIYFVKVIIIQIDFFLSFENKTIQKRTTYPNGLKFYQYAFKAMEIS